MAHYCFGKIIRGFGSFFQVLIHFQISGEIRSHYLILRQMMLSNNQDLSEDLLNSHQPQQHKRKAEDFISSEAAAAVTDTSPCTSTNTSNEEVPADNFDERSSSPSKKKFKAESIHNLSDPYLLPIPPNGVDPYDYYYLMSSERRLHLPAAPIASFSEASPVLKKRNEQISFSKYDIDSYMNKVAVSPQERMRTLDLFNLHNPHPEEECKLYNLPSNRLHLHTLKDIMFLSGGLVGGRFSSDDLKHAGEVTKGLAKQWSEIDSLYKSMSASDRKFVFKTPSQDNNTDIPPPIIVTPDCVTNFHALCDSYLTKIKDLQDLVKRKQSEINLNDASSKGKKGIVRYPTLGFSLINALNCVYLFQ